jgi:GNAT superfamily N-acetyltransferase
MEIIDYYSSNNREHWLNQINKSDWIAGKYLYQLLLTNSLKELCSTTTKVLLLFDSDNLLSFCTLAEQDDVNCPTLYPWIGFVYTFPEHRNKHYAGKLLEHAYNLSKKKGHSKIYISTNEIGLYEKYGYSFLGIMKDKHGDDTRVYCIDVK